MHEKLIDEKNYPRSDIDVYAVRVARNRIICKKILLCTVVLKFQLFEFFKTKLRYGVLLTHSSNFAFSIENQRFTK